MTTDTLRPDRGAAILALGFGTTVGMWTTGYACRLFGDAVPAPAVFALLLVVLLLGGWVAGRLAPGGSRVALAGGLVTGILNLLLVGSLLGGSAPNTVKQGALLWIAGTLAVCTAGVFGGAVIGRALRRSSGPTRAVDWPGALAGVAAVATFVLLAVGGLVTGFDEGLAVVDWPNTEGYNMFLYPLARMTGGVYLEHSHRLFGSLVGLTTLVLAIHTQFTSRTRGTKLLVWAALLMVVIQGVLGGLRVTGRLTLATDPAGTDPNIALAIIHGVFGQLVFAALVVAAVIRTRRWADAGEPVEAPTASTDRFFGVALVVALILQLVLGALVRHFTWALDILRYGLPIDPQLLIAIGQHMLSMHITFAVVVVLVAVGVGVRAWGFYRQVPALRRWGVTLLWLAGVQVALGIAALTVTGNDALDRRPAALDVAITTTHQMVGAAMLACAVSLVLWNYRLLRVTRPSAAVARVAMRIPGAAGGMPQ